MASFEEYASTNPWAARFAEQAKLDAEARRRAVEKAARTREYKDNRPKAITDFEALLIRHGKKPPKGGYDDRKANGLTDFCLDYLRFYGFYGARINTGGTAIGATGAGGREKLKYAESKSTKGVADIIACIRGHFCQYEIKAGKDRPRKDQLEQQQLTISAGGDYIFIHNATEFVDSVRTISSKEYGR